MFWNKKVRTITIAAITLAALTPLSYAMAEEGGFDISATSASSVADKIQWHGSFEFEYYDAEGANSTFDAHKIVVWMGVPINDKVFLSSEIEYEHFPRRGASPGAGGEGEIKVDSAQLSITPFEGLRDYLGVFYVPFGIEYLSYPGQKNKMITRPKVMKSGSIIPGTWSDVGIGFNYALDGVGQLDVYYVNGDAKNGGVSRDTNKAGGNESKSLGVRVMVDGFAEGINGGFSYVTGKHDVGNRYDSTRTGIHLRVDSDKIFGNEIYPVFIAEYVAGKDKGAAADTKKRGYYGQLSSMINPMVEVAIRYGQYDNDEDAADNKKTETSIGLVLHKWDSLQVKAEYQLNGEEGVDTKNDVLAFQVVAFW